MITGLVGAVAALAGEFRRRERALESRQTARRVGVQVDLPEEQRVDLAYRKKLSPAECDMVVWLS